MHDNETLIRTFYEAFQHRDFRAMQECYHPSAKFSDPVFQRLNAREVKGMWQMLISASKDLAITFDAVSGGPDTGKCHWEAVYTFSKTGKKVHNRIDATFRFSEGKIIDHQDRFNFWKWSSMALGTPGLLLGWTPLIRNKIRSSARQSLDAFLLRQGGQRTQ